VNKMGFWQPRKLVGGLAAPLVLLALLSAPANAYPRPGITERVSVASDGAEANSGSLDSAISAEGRHIAFWSEASNLVPGDTNGVYDVFVRDRATGRTTRVSVASDGAEGSGNSYDPAISADGRHVAFLSQSSNLVPGDTNGVQDVFVHDREDGITERVSVASDGAEGDRISALCAISADGRYVTFHSTATNLVPGDTNAAHDVFVHDRETGITERVSVSSDGAEGNGISLAPAISADGRYVAFYSAAFNLVSGDANGVNDVFVHDRETGITERVSVSSDGSGGNAGSLVPAISADGRYVAFYSSAFNLVPGDTNGVSTDIFVHDRGTETTERVSVASDGTEANASSDFPAISADGRHVAFYSPASNLVAGDTNARDVFVHDRATAETRLVSVASDGAQANASIISSYTPAISADGRHVGFQAPASNLVPGDSNGFRDVFVHDQGDTLGVVGTPAVLKSPEGVEVSGRTTLSGATFAGATDPDDDGAGLAAEVGAELTGAALIYRPEEEDVLVRLDLSSLPPAAGGLPGVLYGMELTSAGNTFQVRALRAAATTDPPQVPHVALYRCAPDCNEHTLLTGSFGTTGEQVLVSVPLSALGAAEGTELTGLRAFTALGEATLGTVVALDEVPLGLSTVPASRVELGIAPVSTPAASVVFTVEADLVAGEFSGTVPTEGLSPGSYRAWARACLGDACGPAVFGAVIL
jgi:Tol biopolymer transport system component